MGSTAQPGPGWPAHAGPPPGSGWPQPAGGYPNAGWPGAGAPGPRCRVCGAAPAAQTTLREHQGFFVLMRFRSEPGPFCRDCGTSRLRAMSARTLWQGWWGIASLLITPVVLVMNLGANLKIKKLPPPGPAYGPRPRPEPPLTRRPAALGVLVPLAALVLVVGVIVGSQPGATRVSTGDCVRRDGDGVAVVGCDSPDAQFLVLSRVSGDSDALCELMARSTATYTETGGGSDFVLCLAPAPGADSGSDQQDQPGRGQGGTGGGTDTDTRDA
ncbi:hypothetical protein CcI49_02230 [Frankia sp. CcI49]|uniref:LppU/SCO3897 family protein n=1 Tax=Frankia sp. CcI49 TaxID=1745382 RepID=UPI000976CE1B|nr:hypothetical protein [Frankia sp. CcI49]ONH62231.1 hypothetical protein CcI49_02230 [Frankia sp. CcI49]